MISRPSITVVRTPVRGLSNTTVAVWVGSPRSALPGNTLTSFAPSAGGSGNCAGITARNPRPPSTARTVRTGWTTSPAEKRGSAAFIASITSSMEIRLATSASPMSLARTDAVPALSAAAWSSVSSRSSASSRSALRATQVSQIATSGAVTSTPSSGARPQKEHLRPLDASVRVSRFAIAQSPSVGRRWCHLGSAGPRSPSSRRARSFYPADDARAAGGASMRAARGRARSRRLVAEHRHRRDSLVREERVAGMSKTLTCTPSKGPATRSSCAC